MSIVSKISVWASIAVLATAMAGCSTIQSMCGCGAKVEAGNCMIVCSKCGAPKGECKCGATMTQLPVIGTAALRTLIESGVPVILVDSRMGKYDDGRRIPGAMSLSPASTEQEIQSALRSKDSLIVSYCANPKCHVSLTMAVRLQGLGYTHVLEYPQGIEGWATAGNSVSHASK